MFIYIYIYTHSNTPLSLWKFPKSQVLPHVLPVRLPVLTSPHPRNFVECWIKCIIEKGHCLFHRLLIDFICSHILFFRWKLFFCMFWGGMVYFLFLFNCLYLFLCFCCILVEVKMHVRCCVVVEQEPILSYSTQEFGLDFFRWEHHKIATSRLVFHSEFTFSFFFSFLFYYYFFSFLTIEFAGCLPIKAGKHNVINWSLQIGFFRPGLDLFGNKF